MSTNDVTGTRSRATRWIVPGTALAIGAAYLGAGLLGDDPSFGVGGLVLMSVVAVGLLLLGRKSETVAGLLDRRDERINQIDLVASTTAGLTVLAAVLVMFIVEVAQGHDGAPYYQLGALGGVAYIVALVVLRFRR